MSSFNTWTNGQMLDTKYTLRNNFGYSDRQRNRQRSMISNLCKNCVPVAT